MVAQVCHSDFSSLLLIFSKNFIKKKKLKSKKKLFIQFVFPFEKNFKKLNKY